MACRCSRSSPLTSIQSTPTDGLKGTRIASGRAPSRDYPRDVHRAVPTRAGIWHKPRTSAPAHLFQYPMSMLETLQQIPFPHWKAAKRWFRDNYATVDWPESPDHVRLAIDICTLEEQLRRHHFEDGSGWSLQYDGEVLNMRRPAGEGLDGMAMEEHLRARPVGDDLEINGHVEPNRWEHKQAHVDEEGLTWLDEHELRIVLEGCGVDVEQLEV